ncbi:Signal transduction histidine kinase [Bacteroidales bacterium WCE2004]|nr:Signal transduction histidine kinase [Bacteroidales bacterium WCE2004]
MNHIKSFLLLLVLLTANIPVYCQTSVRQEDVPAVVSKYTQYPQGDMVPRERFVGTVAALVFIVLAFILVLFFRHQAAMRLEAAYMDLEEANARAQESARMKTQFIHQISHEIRTPLNLLAGFTQILAMSDAELDSETRATLKKQITDNTGRITSLINKMLELSEASSNTFLDRSESISAMQIASEAADISGVSTARHIDLDLQLPVEAAATIRTNKSAAVRALALVLDNARKFTAPAGATRDAVPTKKQRVTLRVVKDPEQVRFVVEDTGIGIPPEKAEEIFKEFVQLNDYYDGTGIGLTVARSLARRLGGDVRLDSTYSGGARFLFTLPS